MVLIGNDMFLFGNVMRCLCPYDICSLLRHPLWSLLTTSGYEGLRWVRRPHTSDGCIDCACTYLSHSSMVRLIGVTSPQQGPLFLFGFVPPHSPPFPLAPPHCTLQQIRPSPFWISKSQNHSNIVFDEFKPTEPRQRKFSMISKLR